MSKQQKFRMSARHLDPKSLAFSVLTADDIRNLSVKKITTSDSFNMLGHPLIGGLYDPALGNINIKTEIVFIDKIFIFYSYI